MEFGQEAEPSGPTDGVHVKPASRRRSFPRIFERDGDLFVMTAKRHGGVLEGRRGEESFGVVAQPVALGGQPDAFSWSLPLSFSS